MSYPFPYKGLTVIVTIGISRCTVLEIPGKSFRNQRSALIAITNSLKGTL